MNTTIEIAIHLMHSALVRKYQQVYNEPYEPEDKDYTMENDVLIEDDDSGFCFQCNCWEPIGKFYDGKMHSQPCKGCFIEDEDDKDKVETENQELGRTIKMNNTRIEELKEQDRRRDEEVARLVGLLTEEDFLKRFKIIEEVCPLKELLTKFERGIVMTCIDNNITKTNALHVMEVKYPRIFGIVSNNWDYYYNMYLKTKN